MANIADMLAAAQQCRQTGNLGEAERRYRDILVASPDCGEAWHLLGGVMEQQGRHDLAIEYGRRAVQLIPQSAAAHSDFGTALLSLGRLDEAVSVLRIAVELAPNVAPLWFNLGNALKAAGKTAEAVDCYRRAIDLAPELAAAQCNLAACLHEMGDLHAALLACRAALRQEPASAHAYTVLGNVFKDLERLSDAAMCYQQALSIAPNLVEALSGLGGVCQSQGKFDEAVACFRRALELNPNHASAINNLGATLLYCGNLQDATTCFCRAIELAPDLADAHVNLASVLLRTGDFDRGWAEYEWRWQTKLMRRRSFAQPEWNGQPLGGRTILLYAEQGFGDTLQFIRYAKILKERGAAVVVECPPRLKKLLASCPGIDRLVGAGEPLPPFDFHVPLLSLPRLFRTTLDTIPCNVPYLFADPALIAHWDAKLQGIAGFRVGVNWHGRQGEGLFQQRDIPIEHFTALARMPGVRLISLQKDAGQTDSTIVSLGDNIDEELGAFMDTAAIMMNLDLVITSDTAICHLAGALGVPVWLALPSLSDFRWLLDRSDSPWYPTVRLFRQQRPGDWAAVFAEIETALRNVLARDASRPPS